MTSSRGSADARLRIEVDAAEAVHQQVAEEVGARRSVGRVDALVAREDVGRALLLDERADVVVVVEPVLPAGVAAP